MAIVGSATVIIRAITDKLESDIKNALDKIKPAASSSGSGAGKEWSKAFGFAAAHDGNGLFDKIKGAAESAGSSNGRSWSRRFMSSVSSSLSSGGSRLSSIGGGMGRAFGNAFKDGFGSSGASKSVLAMGARIAALIPIIGALVAAISNAVSGLYAMAAAAGGAVNSLAALGSVLGALVQGGITTAVAFQGVGRAISEGMKAANASTTKAASDLKIKAQNMARAVADAQRNLADAHRQAAQAIQDAKRNVQDATRGVAQAHRDAADLIRNATRDVRDAVRGVADAHQKAAEQIKSALQAVKDAQRGVADATREAAQRERDAINQVIQAEHNLAASHDAVRKAQEALTQARKDARAELLDLKFQTEQNQIDERQAQIALSDAKFQLDATSGLPETNRARLEAELAYQQAVLNLKEVRAKQDDLSKQNEQVKKKGIEGTQVVQSAEQNLLDAKKQVTQATKDLADAQRNENEVQKENIRLIADAKRNLAQQREELKKAYQEAPRLIADANRALRDAKRALHEAYYDAPRMIADANRQLRDSKEALKEAYQNAPRLIGDAKRALAEARHEQEQANQAFKVGSTDAQNYQDALANLSPAARNFVKYILSIRDQLKSLRAAAQAGLFPRLQDAIQILVVKLFPSLRKALYDTGAAVGDAAKTIARDITSGPFLKSFGRVTEQNTVTIRRMGHVFGDLARILVALLDAARPVTDEFTKWAVMWFDNIRKTTEAKNRNGDLTKSFEKSAKTMKLLINITKNIIEGFYDFGKIASKSGLGLLKSFEKVTQSFADFTDKPKNRKYLDQFFQATSKNFRALGHLIAVIGKQFLKLGAGKGLSGIFNGLAKAVPKIAKLINTMLNNSGQSITKFLNALLDTFNQLAKSGALRVFLNVLTGFFKVLNFGLKNSHGAVSFLLQFGAALYALSIIKKFPFVAQLYSFFRSIGRQTLMAITHTKDMGAAMMTVRGKAATMAKGLAGASVKGAKSLGGLVLKFGALSKAAAVSVARNASAIAGAIQHVTKYYAIQTAAAIKNKAVAIASAAATKAVALATKAWAIAQGIFNVVMNANPIFLIITGLVALGAALVIAYKKFDGFRKVVDTVFHAIVDAAKWVWDVLFGHSIFPDMLKAFKEIFKLIGSVIKVWVALFKTEITIIKAVVEKVIIPVFKFLLKSVKTIFDGIATAIKFYWDHVTKPVFDAYVKVIKSVIVPVIKFLWDQTKKLFGFMGDLIKKIWNSVIKPIFNAYRDFIKKILVPIIKFFWDQTKKLFGLIGDFIKKTWRNVIKPIFDALRDFVKKILVPAFKFLWDKVRGFFNFIGDKIKAVWRNGIRPIWYAMIDFVHKHLVPAFRNGIHAIGNIWNSLKRLAAVPVNFVIGTVYNKGIRGLINKVLGWFNVDKRLPKIPLVNWGSGGGGGGGAGNPGQSNHNGGMGGHNLATGGILPGYTPGRDVHKFVSPSGGRLELSGGEAVMRPEFTRALGANRIHALNAAARRGGVEGVNMAMGRFANGGIVNPDQVVYMNGEPVSRITRAQILLAQRLSGKHFSTIQGSWQPATSYSGTTHTGPGVVDEAPGNFSTQFWLRRVGFAAWGRNFPGAHYAGSGAHVHAVSRLDPGVRGSAAQQIQDFLHGGDGLGGSDYGPNPAPLPGLLGKLKKFANVQFHGGAGAGGGGGVLAWLVKHALDPVAHFVDNITDRIGGKGLWSNMLAKVPSTLFNAFENWAISKAGSVTGGPIGQSVSPVTIPKGRVASIVKQLASQRHWGSGPEWNALAHIVSSESSWNPNAQNPNSTAYGLFQFLDSTWSGVGGHKTSDPRLQTIYGLRYIAERYGDPIHAWNFHKARGWYDMGGIARGADAWIPKRTAAPERVLSPRQTEAFERLVDVLDNGGGSGGSINLTVHVPQEASARDVVDGIVYELRRGKYMRGGRYR